MAQKGERSSSKAFAKYMRDRGIHRTTGRCGACGVMHPIDSESTAYRHNCNVRLEGSTTYRRHRARMMARNR